MSNRKSLKIIDTKEHQHRSHDRQFLAMCPFRDMRHFFYTSRFSLSHVFFSQPAKVSQCQAKVSHFSATYPYWRHVVLSVVFSFFFNLFLIKTVSIIVFNVIISPLQLLQSSLLLLLTKFNIPTNVLQYYFKSFFCTAG